MAHRLTTDLLLSFGGYETSFPKLVVEYTHHRAFNGGRDEPSTAEHVEIGCVYVDRGEGHRDPLPEWMIEGMTESLEALCLEDWRQADALSREDAAEMRRLSIHSVAAE